MKHHPTVEEILAPSDVTCTDCDKTFSQPSALRLHRIKVHRIVKNDHDLAILHRLPRGQPDEYHCPQKGCQYHGDGNNKSFKNFKYLKQHYMKVHAEKKYVCESCSRGFGLQTSLKEHLAICGITYYCTDCSCKYNNIQSLKLHCKNKNHTMPPVLKNSHINSYVTKTSEKEKAYVVGDKRALDGKDEAIQKKLKKYRPILEMPAAIDVSRSVFIQTDNKVRILQDAGTQTDKQESPESNKKRKGPKRKYKPKMVDTAVPVFSPVSSILGPFINNDFMHSETQTPILDTVLNSEFITSETQTMALLEEFEAAQNISTQTNRSFLSRSMTNFHQNIETQTPVSCMETQTQMPAMETQTLVPNMGTQTQVPSIETLLYRSNNVYSEAGTETPLWTGGNTVSQSVCSVSDLCDTGVSNSVTNWSSQWPESNWSTNDQQTSTDTYLSNNQTQTIDSVFDQFFSNMETQTGDDLPFPGFPCISCETQTTTIDLDIFSSRETQTPRQQIHTPPPTHVQSNSIETQTFFPDIDLTDTLTDSHTQTTLSDLALFMQNLDSNS